MFKCSVNKWNKVLISFIILAFIVFFLGQLLHDKAAKRGQHKINSLSYSNDIPLVIWWTPLLTGYSETRLCDKYFCKFSTKRDKIDSAKAFLFYGSDIKIDSFPLPRQTHHVWGLMHEESPRNVAYMPYNNWLQHFNFTSTFSRHSDLPLTTYYLPHPDNLTTPIYNVPIGEKSLHKDQGLVLFIQSDCDTMSGRDDYVKELMNYIRIDSYGACLKNQELPESRNNCRIVVKKLCYSMMQLSGSNTKSCAKIFIRRKSLYKSHGANTKLHKLQHDYLNKLYAPELLKFMARYKFIISYENGVCHDYITEKFWRPLIAGSIPIYFGSPTIKDWSPNEKSFIDISNFSSPQSLAQYLKELDANDRAYNSYLNHKYNMIQPITNKRLINELGRRLSSMYSNNQFQSFECAVCSFLHEHNNKPQKHIASDLHYQCPHEPVYPPMSYKVSNHDDWYSVMSIGKCKASILDYLLKRNQMYTKEEFMELLTKEVNLGKC